MLIELFEALLEALRFRDIEPEVICRIDSPVGFIWFKAGDQSYCIDIRKVDFDLDEFPKQGSKFTSNKR